MSPVVSIIVPVYNAEKSIRRCVESVLNQGFEEFELILVDDGSKDSSGQICDEYAGKDGRVHVFHKENSGVSDTRNMALQHARGTYIQFMDSDDWITPDATSLMVRAARESACDMVISDFYRVVGDRVSHKGDIEKGGLLSLEEFAAFMMENPADYYYGVLWNKLFKREIIEAYGLRMDKNISWCEDFMFNLEYIRHTKTIYALRVPVYYYVKTKGSLASQGLSITKTIKMKRMIFEYYHDFYKSVLTEEDYEKNRITVYKFLVDAAGDGIVPVSIFPNTWKLGDERTSVNKEVLAGDGVLLSVYRDRKLLAHYLESAAIKHDLSLHETVLLLYLSQKPTIKTLKDLADITGMTRSRLTLALQKLIVRELIQAEDSVNITLLPGAAPVLSDLAAAQRDYEAAKFAGFSEEDMIQYAYLSNKVKENIRNVLQKEGTDIVPPKRKR